MTDVVTSADRSDGPLAFSRLADLGSLLKRSDLGLAVGVMAILVILILPLAISITFSVLILMTSLFIQAPLEFSAFPTVLLIATMLRLALNLASTRLILARGHEGTDAAGHVIQAFGNFVMAGNFIIGIIVFTILVIVTKPSKPRVLCQYTRNSWNRQTSSVVAGVNYGVTPCRARWCDILRSASIGQPGTRKAHPTSPAGRLARLCWGHARSGPRRDHRPASRGRPQLLQG